METVSYKKFREEYEKNIEVVYGEKMAMVIDKKAGVIEICKFEHVFWNKSLMISNAFERSMSHDTRRTN